MSTRTITLEFDEELFTLIEELAAHVGYKSAQDYANALVSISVFDALEGCYAMAGRVIEDDRKYRDHLDFDDGIPF